jgi:hypothetical protein
MMLAEISFESELMIQLRTILLHLVHALKSGEESNGFVVDPLIKQSLFLALRAINIDRLKNYNFHQSKVEKQESVLDYLREEEIENPRIDHEEQWKKKRN